MNIRISIGISCLLIHPQPPRLSIRRGRSDAIGGVLCRNLSLHHSTAQTAGKENRRFRVYPNLRARDGRLIFRISGQEPEICSTMVYKDDRTGPRPGRNCRQMSFESLVLIFGARTTRWPCAATRRPPSPANIAAAHCPLFGEKFVSPCSYTPKTVAGAQTRHLSTRGRHMSTRGRHLSHSVATERGPRHPVTNARPNILSREKKNFLEKDDIGRHWSTSDTLSIPFPPPASSPAAHTTDRAAHGRPGKAHAAAIPPHFGAPAVAQPVGSRFCGGI